MQYIYSRPESPTFSSRGLSGYSFGPLKTKELEVHWIDVQHGHDTFQVSKRITRIYYVLSGTGFFTVKDQRIDVSPGVLVEIPPKVEYSYSGTMRLVAFTTPRWFRGNDTATKWNPDAVGEDIASGPVVRGLFTRLAQKHICGKSPARAYLRLNQRMWNSFPRHVTALPFIQRYGAFLNRLTLAEGTRQQALATFFLRNRPLLELILRLANRSNNGEVLKIAVLGCSSGAEAYSVAWIIGSANPQLDFSLAAVDVAPQAVEFARRGVYSARPSEITATSMLERMTPAEIDSMFDKVEDGFRIKDWVRDRIHWHIGDVRESTTLEILGPQDIVIANNFLCHMDPTEARRTLCDIARSVRKGGHLIGTGVDLDVRTEIANKMGWQPIEDLLEDIHEGDPCAREQWPCLYAGLEPLDKSRDDWKLRYAVAFRINQEEVSPERQHTYASASSR